MNPRILFEQFPDAEKCYVAGSDAFLKEKDAEDHAEHFKLIVKKVLREELEEAPKHEIKSAKAVVSSKSDAEDENSEAEGNENTQTAEETAKVKKAKADSDVASQAPA